jgi:hypothetical protein
VLQKLGLGQPFWAKPVAPTTGETRRVSMARLVARCWRKSSLGSPEIMPGDNQSLRAALFGD